MQLFTKAMPRLKLNPEKRRIIRDILENHQEALAQARTTFSKAVQTMNQMALETENEEDIRTAATDVGQALGDLMVLSANIYIELKEELTPEQQTILKNMNKPLQRSLPQRRNKLLQKKRDTEK
jgi:Spy/CpxP family protein refolding chaperone